MFNITSEEISKKFLRILGDDTMSDTVKFDLDAPVKGWEVRDLSYTTLYATKAEAEKVALKRSSKSQDEYLITEVVGYTTVPVPANAKLHSL